MDFDQKIQNAMRAHGGPHFEFDRGHVVQLLVEGLQAMTTALACSDDTMTSEDIVMANAVALAQIQAPWMQGLSIVVILSLLSALAAGRASYLRIVTKKDMEREAKDNAHSFARNLRDAVDDYSGLVTTLTERYMWNEKDRNQRHMSWVASSMLRGGDDFGKDLPPLRVVTCEADRQRYLEEDRRTLAAQEAAKLAEAAEKKVADENVVPTRWHASKSSAVPPLTWTSGYYLTDDSFGAGYDDPIDPWEADGHPSEEAHEGRVSAGPGRSAAGSVSAGGRRRRFGQGRGRGYD
jgi:hypothetical protein